MWVECRYGMKCLWRTGDSPSDARLIPALLWWVKRLLALAILNVPAWLYVMGQPVTGGLPTFWYQPMPTVAGLAGLLVLSLMLPLVVETALHEAPTRHWWPVAPGHAYRAVVLGVLSEFLFLWAVVAWPVSTLLLGLNGIAQGKLAIMVLMLTFGGLLGGLAVTVLLKAIQTRWPRQDPAAVAWGLIGGVGLLSMCLLAGLGGSIEIASWSAATLSHVVLKALSRWFGLLHAAGSVNLAWGAIAAMGALLATLAMTCLLSHLHHRHTVRPAPFESSHGRLLLGRVGSRKIRHAAWTLARRDLLMTAREPKELVQQVVMFVVFLMSLPLIFKDTSVQLRLFLAWSLGLGLAGTVPIHAVGREGFGLATISRVMGIPAYLRVRALMTVALLATVSLPAVAVVLWLGRDSLAASSLLLLVALALVNIVGLTGHAIGAGALFADLAEKRVLRNRGVTFSGEAVFWLGGGLWIVGQAVLARDFVFGVSDRGWLGAVLIVCGCIYFGGQWALAIHTLSRRV